MASRLSILARKCAGVCALLFLTGCQGFNGMLARFKPSTPNPSPMSSEAPPLPPITKEQKLDMQMAVARSYENDGNMDQAIQVYDDVLTKDNRRIDAYHRLAILHDMKGDPKKSREYYLTAIQKAPKSAELYCDFGYSCYLQRNWADAETNLRRALELKPQFARAHTNLGLLLARTFHSPEALAEFSKAGCDEAAARCNLAFALALEDRCAESRQQYELALAADPKSTAAKQGLAALQNCTSAGDVAPMPAPRNAVQPATVQASFVPANTQRF